MTGWRLVLAYAGFAVVATAINLGVQRVVLAFGEGPVPFALAMILGTAAGLVAKYLMDKRWIFADAESGLAAHGRKFGLYAVMGLATTAIFWATETAFWLTWGTDAMRELGAVLGLGVGYTVKYFLDCRFVFRPAGSGA